ncbi:MAG: ZIP family metal transporter, partial [Eubacteriales bacterium]|nr:ZIP family metal transporter [Eubacteriales bacterium]
MIQTTALGILIPFIGTTLGAACVYFLKGEIRPQVQKALLGFASGVMIAASVWSLLIPAMDMSVDMGRLAFIPAAVGFLLGIIFLLFLDQVIPHMHIDMQEEGPHAHLKKNTMLVLAVTLHNIPEGMAVGVVFAGWLSGGVNMTMAGAFALAIGIAIQNFPEGAIISMPLLSAGKSKHKAF